MDAYISVKKVQSDGVPVEHDGKMCVKLLYPDGYESYVPEEIFLKNYLNVDKADSISEEVQNALEFLLDCAENGFYN